MQAQEKADGKLSVWWARNWWVLPLLLTCFGLGAVLGFYWALPFLEQVMP